MSAFERGRFRVRGDVVEIHPAYEQFAYRVEMFGDEIERLQLINPTTGEGIASEDHIFIFPAVHYVMPEDRVAAALESISRGVGVTTAGVQATGETAGGAAIGRSNPVRYGNDQRGGDSARESKTTPGTSTVRKPAPNLTRWLTIFPMITCWLLTNHM